MNDWAIYDAHVIARTIGAILFIALLTTGCAGPGPRLVPIVPRETRTAEGGTVERLYDTFADKKINYCERLGPDGRVAMLRFDLNNDGQFDLDVARNQVGPEDRQLIILVDSVPYGVVRDMYEQGRFRLFHPPSRTISPFPVMTDLSFSEFFGVSPCPGVESEYFDGKVLQEGYKNYAHEANMPWKVCTDYHLINFAHAIAYFYPDDWFDHELHFIQKYFLERSQPMFIGYCVGTSALGAKQGRNGHLGGLIRLDRLCQQLMYDSRGKLQITLMSDHGHNLVPSKRVPLAETLEKCGYHVNIRLDRPGDVVVPEFGVVTCAAISTHEPAAVAHDLINVEGIEQTMFVNANDEIVVLSRDGLARIAKSGNAYRYAAEKGDPLKLNGILDSLTKQGKVNSEGFVDDRVLFDATNAAEYPDALHRLWRAYHGLVEHTPEVMVTSRDGWHCGSKFMSNAFDMQATHGNLGLPGSCGFVMTTAGTLPPVMRMEDLKAALGKVEVKVDRGAAAKP